MDKPEETSAMAITKTGSLVKLFYKAGKESNVKVTIIDAEDKIVFTEEIKHVEGFMRPYNFSNLPEGDYTFELVDHSGKKIEKISYRNGKIERLANLIQIVSEGDKYLLTIPNKGKGIFDVKIYDTAGNLLYTHAEEADGDFAKVYNLSKVSGKFSFEITDKSGSTKFIDNK